MFCFNSVYVPIDALFAYTAPFGYQVAEIHWITTKFPLCFNLNDSSPGSKYFLFACVFLLLQNMELLM